MTDTRNANTDRPSGPTESYAEIVQLVGSLAHEIKNPLSTIRLNMDLLAEDFEESDSPRDRRALTKVERVQRECQRLEDILTSFLRFTRAKHLDLRPGDLSDIVAEVLALYGPRAVKSGIEVSEFLPGDLPSVLLDSEPLRAALVNLIINAIDAMPDGGQLLVRTFEEGKHVALQLIDTGKGMDRKTQARIFDAFYSTKRGGSGLGLPIVRRIVEAHGGEIEVQSEVGHGTQITIRLPMLMRLPRTEDA